MGKRVNERTDTAISVALPIVERERWKKYAKEANLSLSAFVRRGVNVYIAMLDKKARDKKLLDSGKELLNSDK